MSAAAKTKKTQKVLAGGLGLGVFIATTLIERTSGKVKFGSSPQGGAQSETSLA